MCIHHLGNDKVLPENSLMESCQIFQTDDMNMQIKIGGCRACAILVKICSINFEPPDIDLCPACHVYLISRGAWIFSILFIPNRFTPDLPGVELDNLRLQLHGTIYRPDSFV